MNAKETGKRSGFNVVYGPVRATDIKAFLEANMKATADMRRVNFNLFDKIVLTPMELVIALKPAVIFFGVLFVLNALGLGKFGLTDLFAFTGALVVGCVLTPILLPYIPGKSFSQKGALTGLLWTILILYINGWLPGFGYLKAVSYILLLPSVSAYLALNFTGSSTYTSPSGVNKEMQVAIPLMLASTVLGCLLLLADSLFKSFINLKI